MTNTATAAQTTCRFCEIDAKRTAGETITERERSYWMMWGCTCTAEAAAEATATEATATMKAVTR